MCMYVLRLKYNQHCKISRISILTLIIVNYNNNNLNIDGLIFENCIRKIIQLVIQSVALFI